MAEFKGTKGNWKVGTNFSNIVTDEKTERPSYTKENYESEIEYYGGYLICESVSKKADAKLIASSPELLEALNEMVRMYEEVQPAGGWQGVYELAKYAIKKATE